MSDRSSGRGEACPLTLAVSPAQRYPAHVTLFHQDESAPEVYLILTGCTKLVVAALDSEPDVIVGLRGPGWLLGVEAATLDWPHAASAETLTPTVLRRIDTRTFRKLIASDLTIGPWLRRMQAQETYEQRQRLAILRRDPINRILWLLRELMKEAKVVRRANCWAFEPVLTRMEMGQIAALTAEHVSRVLGQLEMRGVLTRDQGWIVVPTGSPLAVPLEGLGPGLTDERSL